MRLLLDTCAIIWIAADAPALTASVRRELANADDEVFFSPVSAAELACAQKRGRLEFDQHWKSWLRHQITRNGWEEISPDLRIIEEAYSLPEPFHADPVDRVLVATARLHQLHLVTGDRKLLEYPHVQTLW